MLKITTNLELHSTWTKKRDVMKEFYLIKRSLLIYHNFTIFLEEYNIYRAESFNVN